MFRIGQGYDVHRLVEGRELWLCGVKVEHDLGLDGHSDADMPSATLCSVRSPSETSASISRTPTRDTKG